MLLDDLQTELVTLGAILNENGITFLLGGGMGLFVRERHFRAERQSRYRRALPPRSTKDLDLFLGADVIVDAERMSGLRRILGEQGYDARPEARFFQFEKIVDDRRMRIDLLAAPPREEDRAKVTIKAHRIRPNDSPGIHAYLTSEAAGIERGRIRVEVPTAHGTTVPVFIPSSFSYLLLKLHAFADRRDDSELARHHALDIFRIVTDMTDDDWSSAAEHLAVENDAPAVRRACEIRRTDFSDERSDGIIALTSHREFLAEQEELAPYIPHLLTDLRDLLPD